MSPPALQGVPTSGNGDKAAPGAGGGWQGRVPGVQAPTDPFQQLLSALILLLGWFLACPWPAMDFTPGTFKPLFHLFLLLLGQPESLPSPASPRGMTTAALGRCRARPSRGIWDMCWSPCPAGRSLFPAQNPRTELGGDGAGAGCTSTPVAIQYRFGHSTPHPIPHPTTPSHTPQCQG